MNSFRIIALTVGLFTGCLQITLAEPQRNKVEGWSGQENPHAGYIYRRYGYYPGYTPRRGPALPDKGRVLSDQVCVNPTISRICRRAYKPFPGAVWRYRYATETERQADESTARHFAQQHGGYVVHENKAYVVYKPIRQCSFEVTACETLQD
jgi:hypothetical protein